jgi:inorganic pyrophosphatase
MYIQSKTTSSWQDKRIKAMNKVIKNHNKKEESFIEEYNRVSNSKAINKKQYKGESNANS